MLKLTLDNREGKNEKKNRSTQLTIIFTKSLYHVDNLIELLFTYTRPFSPCSRSLFEEMC